MFMVIVMGLMVAVKITEMDSHLKLFNCVICVA